MDDSDRLFHRGITLFAVITLIALFGLFIALNNMVNAQDDLAFRNKAYGICESRVTMLEHNLSECNIALGRCHLNIYNDRISYINMSGVR
jgi:hypothetical protein